MATVGSAAPLAIGSRRELFIDDALIERLEGRASRRLHHPVPREIVLRHDEPWEGTGSGYHSVFRDGDRYRMYYKAFNIQVVPGQIVSERTAHRYTCYAESTDGVHWVKPRLGLVDFRGSRTNNIVIASGRHGAINVDAAHPAVFRDTNPAALPEARYKAVFRSDGALGLVAMQSSDGLPWAKGRSSPPGPSIRIIWLSGTRSMAATGPIGEVSPGAPSPKASGNPRVRAGSARQRRRISAVGDRRTPWPTRARLRPRSSTSIRSSPITGRRTC